MLVSCSICSDLFVSASEVFTTTCGHLFHYVCLVEWLERSKTCPQCRYKTTEKTIHRVYFNVQTNDEPDDPNALRNHIENLKFKIHLKDTDIKNAREENNTLKSRNVKLSVRQRFLYCCLSCTPFGAMARSVTLSLSFVYNGCILHRDEYKSVESKCSSLEMSVSALKEQMRFMKQQCNEAEEARIETRRLRAHLETLTNVETIVKGTVSEVEEVLNNGSDCPKTLATYVSVLKRELQAVSDKRKWLREELKAAQSERSRLRNELAGHAAAVKRLEEDLDHSEAEKRSLRKKVTELEQAVLSPTASSQSALRRLVAESPAPPRLTDPRDDQNANTAKTSDDSPYLNIKSSSVGLTPLRPAQSSNLREPARPGGYSIFKKARLTTASSNLATEAHPDLAFDGMGGRSKLDEFPVPRLAVKTKNKPRPAGLANAAKLKKASGQMLKIRSYFDAS
uniref:RING-type domain-containing protein n=1 Tax=Timema shepardi TaxID=629360 RepID=A0A7R9B0P0_TIMSH|nr:unnamed protein product [Timema shepardi]